METIEIRDILDESGKTVFPRTHVDAVIGLKDTNFFEAVTDPTTGTTSIKLKSQYVGLWTDGFVSNGGIGTGGGGGGGGLITSVRSVSDLGTPIATESLTETFSAKAIESIWESLSNFGASLSLSRDVSYFKDSNGNYFLDANGNRIIVGAGESSLNLLDKSGRVLSSVELDLDMSDYASMDWVQQNFLTIATAQTVTGRKTFANTIDANGGIAINSGSVLAQIDGITTVNYGARGTTSLNLYGTSINLMSRNSSGDAANLLAVQNSAIVVGSKITPNDMAGLDLGADSATKRWANIYGVNADLTGDLHLASTSHIDIGPIRIEYDSTSKGLHITKKDPNDTTNYGIYADGFNSTGGAGQPS